MTKKLSLPMKTRKTKPYILQNASNAKQAPVGNVAQAQVGVGNAAQAQSTQPKWVSPTPPAFPDNHEYPVHSVAADQIAAATAYNVAAPTVPSSTNANANQSPIGNVAQAMRDADLVNRAR